MRAVAPLRGQIFHVDLEETGRHFHLVVSNNRRNAHLHDILTVMITTTPPRSPRASYVPLKKGLDPLEGWANCDHLGPVSKDDLGQVKGALSVPTMRRVDVGLVAALSLLRSA